MAKRRKVSRPPSPSDLLEELPPLDEDEADGAEPPLPIEGLDLDLVLSDELSKDDDESSENDLAFVDLDEELAEPSEGAEDEALLELDLTENLLSFEDQEPQARSDDDQPGLVGEDTSVGLAELPELGQEDTALEGPSDSAESPIDESAFPELDSGEEDQEPLEPLGLEELAFAPELVLPAWSTLRWRRLSTPLVDEPLSFVALSQELIVAVGESAVMLSPSEKGELRCTWLPLEGTESDELRALSVDPGEPKRLWTTTRTHLYQSEDAGLTASALSLASVSPGAEPIKGIGTLGPRQDTLYVLTEAGSLLLSPDQGRGWKRLFLQGKMRLLTLDPQGFGYALLEHEGRFRLMSSRDGLDWSDWGLALPCPSESQPSCLCVLRGCCAIGTSQGLLLVSQDRGQHWQSYQLPAGIDALALAQSQDRITVLGSFFLASSEQSLLFGVEPSGSLSLLALLSPAASLLEEEDGGDKARALGLAWDPDRAWLWVAGGFGLVAFAPTEPT